MIPNAVDERRALRSHAATVEADMLGTSTTTGRLVKSPVDGAMPTSGWNYLRQRCLRKPNMDWSVEKVAISAFSGMALPLSPFSSFLGAPLRLTSFVLAMSRLTRGVCPYRSSKRITWLEQIPPLEQVPFQILAFYLSMP